MNPSLNSTAPRTKHFIPIGSMNISEIIVICHGICDQLYRINLVNCNNNQNPECLFLSCNLDLFNACCFI
uniref:Uncharacterized protein n=1 Tax=Oryza brachyantha TaxID=4533 RepID=J3M6B9_ORYBR